MLGLGSNITGISKVGTTIVTDNLVLIHDYKMRAVEPLSSGAASFNGTSDYIAINAKPVDTADATYAWWSNSTQTQHQTNFSHGDSKTGGFHLTFGTTNKPLLYLHSNLYQYWVDTGFADDGKWHHWALVVDVDDMTACKLYCDGVEVNRSSASTSGTATSYGNMEIGRYNTNNEFDGYMCNFGVWSSHLSQAQIKSIMNKNYDSLSASEKTNLVSWWNLDSAIPELTTAVYDNHHGGGETLGSELVTNGDFATDSDWNDSGTGWTISGGNLNASNVNAASTTQSGYTFVGKTFQVSYTISDYSQGSVQIYLGGSQSTSLKSANGTHTETISISSGNTLLYIYGTSNFTGNIDNVSVKPINGNTGTLS